VRPAPAVASVAIISRTIAAAAALRVAFVNVIEIAPLGNDIGAGATVKSAGTAVLALG